MRWLRVVMKRQGPARPLAIGEAQWLSRRGGHTHTGEFRRGWATGLCLMTAAQYSTPTPYRVPGRVSAGFLVTGLCWKNTRIQDLAGDR